MCVFYGLIYYLDIIIAYLASSVALCCSRVLVQLCDPPCTLDQGGVENEWLPKSQCASVEKTECGLVGRNAPGVPVPCSILYSVIESIEAG